MTDHQPFDSPTHETAFNDEPTRRPTMTTHAVPFRLTLAALATAALLAACGGGDATPPPDSGGGGGGGVVVVPTPSTGTVLATFDEATPPAFTEFGGAATGIEASPSGGNGSALRLTRDGGEVYAGVWIAIAPIPNNAGAQTVSARVYSPVAGIPMVAKAEYGDNLGTGDVAANEAIVVGWQTLTWTFTNLTAANVYNRFTILPQLGTVGTGQIYYFDDITLAASTAPPPSGTVLNFSTGFTSNVLTSSGGAIASAGGSNFDDFSGNCGDSNVCGSGAGGSGADSFMYFYYQTPNPATALYSQIELFGPGIAGLSTTGDTGGVTISGQTKVNFTFNPNPEWFNSGSPRLGVVLTLGRRYSIGEGCHIQLHGVTPITSDGSIAYSMNLANEFRVAQDCGTGIAPDNVAGALAASPVVSSVKFLGAGGGAAIIGRDDARSTANLSVAAGTVYPTTVALRGPITFD